jgi:hypothetical protein
MSNKELIKKWENFGLLDGTDEHSKLILSHYLEKCTQLLLSNNEFHKELETVILSIVIHLFKKENTLIFITVNDLINDVDKTLKKIYDPLKSTLLNLKDDEFNGYFVDLYCKNLSLKLIEGNIEIKYNE